MEKTDKQKEVLENELNYQNDIYCDNDRIVRKYYQVSFQLFFQESNFKHLFTRVPLRLELQIVHMYTS